MTQEIQDASVNIQNEEQTTIVPRPTDTPLADRKKGVLQMAQGAVFHDYDLRPPFLKLVQGTSSLGTPGALYRTDTEEEFDELLVVPLRVQAIRTNWPAEGFSRDRLPECVSYDGVRSITEFADGREPRFVGQFCASCEFYTTAPWKVPTGQEYCQSGYEVLLMDIDTFDVYGMRLQGTATRVVRMLGAASYLRKSVLRLWGDKVTNDRGSWYQLKAAVVRNTPEEELSVAEQQCQAFGIGGADL